MTLTAVAAMIAFASQAAPAPAAAQAAPSAVCLALRAEAVTLAEAHVQRSETMMASIQAGQAAVQSQMDGAANRARTGAAVSMATSAAASVVPGLGLATGLVSSLTNLGGGAAGPDTAALRAAEAQAAAAQREMTAGLPDLQRMQVVALQMQANGC